MKIKIYLLIKSFGYAEIKPELISGGSDYNENFLNNQILLKIIFQMGNFRRNINSNNLKIVEFKKINAKKENETKKNQKI